MSDREMFLRRFHARHPGITSAALGRSGSYERLAARAAGAARVLDLGCGDGRLLPLLPSGAIGLDVSREELALAHGRAVVQGRAQALPFADGAFDAVVSHFAFMLFDELELVAGELARVLAPGGAFHAVLGGGPTADGDDAFHRFAGLLPPAPLRLGDPRASSEAGWRALFPGWQIAFERHVLDLSGPFEDVWRFLGASYQLGEPGVVREALRAQFPSDVVPCRVVTWLASAEKWSW